MQLHTYVVTAFGHIAGTVQSKFPIGQPYEMRLISFVFYELFGCSNSFLFVFQARFQAQQLMECEEKLINILKERKIFTYVPIFQKFTCFDKY